MQLVPYNLSISIGAGFNSYTQQLCINDAVEQDPERGNSDTELQNVDGSTGTGQNVVWVSKFVDSVADVTSAMNVSGAVAIKENGNLDSSSGAFVNFENMKGSDLNYLIQVKVTSQHLETNNLTQIRKIAGIKPSDFLEVYGDSFVSGFIEGGEFTALLSIVVASEDDIAIVKLGLQSDFGNLESGESARGQRNIQELVDGGKVTILISVAWIGDTTEDPADVEWTLEAVREAAIDFPQKVAIWPQRTHAALTKYTELKSYREMTNGKELTDYGSTKSYTDQLLDDYFEYKYIWKQIEAASKHASTEAADPHLEVETPGLVTYGIESNAKFDGAPTGYKNPKDLRDKSNPQLPFPATLVGFQQVKRCCKMEMTRILKEVDAIASNPTIVKNGTRQRPYLEPIVIKRLIPEQRKSND